MDRTNHESQTMSRRDFVGTSNAITAGGLAAIGAGVLPARAAAQEKKQASTVALDWKEVYYTNCPLVSASNVDQELGWVKEEYAKIGVQYGYFRSRRETNWYPHYIQEHQGILLMLRINGMTEKDVKIVEFPYPDDWYDDPKMLKPLYNPTEWQLNRDHKHDSAFRPLETALLEGKCDAIYSQVFARSTTSSTAWKGTWSTIRTASSLASG